MYPPEMLVPHQYAIISNLSYKYGYCRVTTLQKTQGTAPYVIVPQRSSTYHAHM